MTYAGTLLTSGVLLPLALMHFINLWSVLKLKWGVGFFSQCEPISLLADQGFTTSLSSLLADQVQGHIIATLSKPKAWKHRLGEFDLKAVEGNPLVSWDFGEGQSALRPVKIHPNSLAATRGERTFPHFAFVPGPQFGLWPGRITNFAKSPRHGVKSKVTTWSPCFSVNATICNTYIHWFFRTFTPVYLPVMDPLQSISCQHLRLCIKPLWAGRICLPCSVCCLLVSLRQREMVVYSVWVHGDVNSNWLRDQNKMCYYSELIIKGGEICTVYYLIPPKRKIKIIFSALRILLLRFFSTDFLDTELWQADISHNMKI